MGIRQSFHWKETHFFGLHGEIMNFVFLSISHIFPCFHCLIFNTIDFFIDLIFYHTIPYLNVVSKVLFRDINGDFHLEVLVISNSKVFRLNPR